MSCIPLTIVSEPISPPSGLPYALCGVREQCDRVCHEASLLEPAPCHVILIDPLQEPSQLPPGAIRVSCLVEQEVHWRGVEALIVEGISRGLPRVYPTAVSSEDEGVKSLSDEHPSDTSEPSSETYSTTSGSECCESLSGDHTPPRDDLLEQVSRVLCTAHLQMQLHEMVLLQALSTPELNAVSFKDHSLTYEQLCQIAWRLAQQLLGVASAGDHIAICLPKDEWRVIGYLACSMAQMPFSEVHLNSPRAVIEHQTALWKPVLLASVRGWTPEWLTSLLSDLMVVVWEPDYIVSPSSIETIFALSSGGSPEDLYCIEWTSGSSGLPKGSTVQHLPMCNQALWRWWTLPATETDPFVCAMNLFLPWYWFFPLVQGGSLVLVPDQVLIDPSALVQYFEDHRVTRWDCATPSLLRALLLSSSERMVSQLSQLTMIHCSGELLEVETCVLFHERFLGATRLLNVYSTTETSADCSWCEITHAVSQELAEARVVGAPIRHEAKSLHGGLIWNCSLELESQHMLRESFGEGAGEVRVCGVPVIARYFKGDPEINAKFSLLENGEKCVMMGDVATEMDSPDGPLLIPLGRVDSAVKIRGHRVELCVVEDALHRVPSVHNAAAIKHGDVLVGFVQLVQGIADRPSESGIISVLRDNGLTPNHIPDMIQLLDELPFTLSGKIDRKALGRQLEHSNRTSPTSSDSSEAIGERVRAAWISVLQHDHFNSESRFFEVGGHSLLAMRLAAELNLSVIDIFEFPSISEQVSTLQF